MNKEIIYDYANTGKGYGYQEIHDEAGIRSISFRSSYCRKSIAFINCRAKTLELRPIKLCPKTTEKVLRVQEKIKRDYPGYKLVEWGSPLARKGLPIYIAT